MAATIHILAQSLFRGRAVCWRCCSALFVGSGGRESTQMMMTQCGATSYVKWLVLCISVFHINASNNTTGRSVFACLTCTRACSSETFAAACICSKRDLLSAG